MSRLLARLQRIRLLLEDQARTELTVRASALHAAEHALQQAQEEKHSLEQSALTALRAHGEEKGEQREARFLLLHAAEMAEPQLEILEQKIREAAARMDASRDQYLARRRERRQAEVLLQEEKARRIHERERAEQRSLDDSFALARWRRSDLEC